MPAEVRAPVPVQTESSDKLKKGLHQALRDIEQNIPFVAKSFDEHMEQRVEKAKSEIAAHMQNAISRAGLAALEAEPPLLLEDHSPA